MNKQIEEMARFMLEKSNSANVEPIFTGKDGTQIVLGEQATKLLNDVLEQAFIPFLADALVKDGYRKATDVAADILDDIIDALTSESIEEEKKANSALEAQDTMSYDVFSYANDKLETLLTALGIFKTLYLKKYEREGEK